MSHLKILLGKLLYDLGNGQWKIPALRTLLEDILSRNIEFHDFEVTHEFESIGRPLTSAQCSSTLRGIWRIGIDFIGDRGRC